jgi:DNA-binding NarL/FixJ family response regulator
MPGSSGLVLAAEVARLRPQLPVVIASGYLSDELSRGAAGLGVRHLMQKQNLFDELVPLVLRILGARSAGLPD